ncbi:AAA family ATPase [Brachyspira pilosicoli]|uniref:AAA family ATPase n=1 Tax=Brachyspira pilosicoli TaxID=52584 RepID=A0AAJ6KD66_BRAPL|nr:AAA family ATPase [Brachyspira pilosicoli]WIH90209.1 AAA family ATPase [Brachyspira pilosicoli]WIH92500.1 AAA family ATPase [Brachyspira pilosicoli]WIH94792.1 AAA family ATPase [Brachyspira pilosicoli]
MFDRHNNISIFVYIAILLNAIIIALFITFVFGLKKDAFDIDTKKLDRTSLICQNNILSLINDYDNRLDKIIESYNFPSLLQNVVLNGMNEDEKNRIISIFRSGNYAFDTVGLYFSDGRAVFSSPDNRKSINLNALKINDKKAFFDQDFDGVYFIKPIKNEKGLEVGYIVASVFKKIFENTSYNLNFLLIPNGVIYYNPSININSISRDTLYQYMNNPGVINIGAYSYILHSSNVKDIYNFNVGILELDVPIIQRYLKYILLIILCSSLIFLISSALYERKKLQTENASDIEDDSIYSSDDNILEDDEYNNFDDDNNLDDFNYDLNTLNEDIEYLNNIESKNKKHIDKKSKLELPNLDDIEKAVDNISKEDLLAIEDLEDIEESINDEAIKVDNVDEVDNDEHLNIENIEDLEKIEESIDDEAIKVDNIDEVDNDEHLNIENIEDLEKIEDSIDDEAIKVDNIDEVDNDEHLNIENIEDLEKIEESIDDEAIKVDNIDEVDNDEHLNIENIEDLEKIEDSIDDEAIKVDNIDEVDNDEHLNIENIEDLEKIEDSIDDEAIKVDNIDEVDNDEHLNIENIEDLEKIEDSIDDETIKVDNIDEVDNDEHLNIENIEDLEDIEDSIDDETIKIDNIDEDLEEEVDDNSIPNIDNLDNNINTVSEEDKELDYVPTLDNVLDENDEDKNILRGIDDIISDNEEDILISHGSMIDNEISKKEDDYFSSLDSFNLALNKDFLFDDDKNEFDKSHNYDSNEVIKKASEDDVFDTEDLIDSELYDPEEKRPPMPEDYKDAEEKVKDNMTSNWKNILKAIKGEKFVNKSLDEMLEWIKEKSGLNVLHSAMLTKDENGIYKISDSKNLTEDTKNKLEIDENEALFKKILSSRKTLYVSDPFSSLSLKIKFDEKDRENISHMIFIPIQDEEAQLKSFFIGLSSN